MTDHGEAQQAPQRPRSPGARFLGTVAEWVVKPAVAALVALMALGALSPWIAVGISRVAPTCTDHPGYAAVDVAAMLRDGKAHVTPTPEEAPDDPRFDGRWAFDRRALGDWAWPVPDPRPPDIDAALASAATGTAPIVTLSVTFDRPLHDVSLVCVLNGDPLDPASYVRADRVERLTVRTSCTTRVATAVLRSQPADQIYDAQRLPVRCRELQSLTLEVMSTYPGQFITDPSSGKIVGPSGFVAIGEVYFYAPVGAGSPDYNRAAGAVHWLYTHPWLTALGAVFLLLLGVGLSSGARRAAPVSPGGAGPGDAAAPRR